MMHALKGGNKLYQMDGMIHGNKSPERESENLRQLTFAASSAKLWCGTMILRLLILVGIFSLGTVTYAAKGGVAPTISATPPTFNFNFAINPQTGGYPKTVVGTFTLVITGSGPDPSIALGNPVGFTPPTGVVLKDSKNKTFQIPSALPAGTYTLAITINDPGQGAPKAPWSVDVNLDSGKTGKASTKLSGQIGRDMPAQPQQQQMTAQQQQMTAPQQQMTAPQQQQQGSNTNAGSAKVNITPWGGGPSNPFVVGNSGGTPRYNSGQRFAVLINVNKRKLQIGTAISVPNTPISRSPKTTLGGNIRPARQLVRGGQKLNMGFVRHVNMSPQAIAGNSPAPPLGTETGPRKMVSGFTSPSITVRRIFGGNVCIQRKNRSAGRALGVSSAVRSARSPARHRRR